MGREQERSRRKAAVRRPIRGASAAERAAERAEQGGEAGGGGGNGAAAAAAPAAGSAGGTSPRPQGPTRRPVADGRKVATIKTASRGNSAKRRRKRTIRSSAAALWDEYNEYKKLVARD